MRFVTPFLLLGYALIAAAQGTPPQLDSRQAIPALSGSMTVEGFTIDSKGNLYICGTTFQTIIGVRNIGPRGQGDIFVMKLDPTGQQVFYTTVIGGSLSDRGALVKVDDSGNAYVLGFTESVDYPYISFQGSGPVYGSVLLKLNSSGDLLFNTVIPWPSNISSFGFDSSGTVYFAGSVISGRLPAIPGSYQSSGSSKSGFLARLSPDGSTLNAATYLDPADSATLIRLLPNGNVLFAAGTTIGTLDALLTNLMSANTTALPPGKLWPYIGMDSSTNMYFLGVPVDVNGTPLGGANEFRKYSPDGQQLLQSHSLDLPTATPGLPRTIVMSSGTVLQFGFANPDFPIHNATQPCAANLQQGASTNPFLALIGADGAPVYATFIDNLAISVLAISPADGRVYAIGNVYPETGEQIIHFNADYRPPDHISAGCMVHSATLQPTGASPGAIMTLFGDGLGPNVGASWDSATPFNLAGTRITVDGKPSPVLYAQNRQINFVMPWSLRTDGAAVPICVSANDQMSCLSVITAPAVPGFFLLNRTIAAINQDGTVNSQRHPAPAGSYVSLYLTGTGALDGFVEDGDIAGLSLHHVAADVSAKVNAPPPDPCTPSCRPPTNTSLNAPVLFAGAVPTIVFGAEVVIMRIPGNMETGLRGVLVRFKSAVSDVSVYGDLWFGPY